MAAGDFVCETPQQAHGAVGVVAGNDGAHLWEVCQRGQGAATVEHVDAQVGWTESPSR